MILEREKPVKGRPLRAVIIKSDGKIWDVELKAPIACLLGDFEGCFGRCKWFSIDEDRIAKCQDTPIGKVDSSVKK